MPPMGATTRGIAVIAKVGMTGELKLPPNAVQSTKNSAEESGYGHTRPTITFGGRSIERGAVTRTRTDGGSCDDTEYC